MCDVITEPSAEALQPTMILVHDIRCMPWREVSSGWATTPVKTIDRRRMSTLRLAPRWLNGWFVFMSNCVVCRCKNKQKTRYFPLFPFFYAIKVATFGKYA